MPGGDRTGPMGMGPMSGRAAGYCAGYPAPGFMNPTPGRGGFWGRGGGRGRGRRNMYWATGLPGWARLGAFPGAAGGLYGGFPPYGAAAYTSTVPKEAELQALQGQADYFRSALDELQKRIGELEAQAEKDE